MAQSKTASRLPAKQERGERKIHAELLRLAQAQGVRPIANLEDLRGDFWPENEPEESDEFDAWLRAVRKERPGGDVPE